MPVRRELQGQVAVLSFVQAGQTKHGFGWYGHEVKEYPSLLVGKPL